MCCLTLSNPIFLPTTYSPALICFGWERGCWITCNYPIVLKEKNIEKQKVYKLHYLLAKVRTTWGKVSDRLRQRSNKRNKNHVGCLPTSERNRKIIMSDEVRRRIGKGQPYCQLLRLYSIGDITKHHGTPERYWQAKTKVLGETPVLLPLFLSQMPHLLTCDWNPAFAVKGQPEAWHGPTKSAAVGE
jgi:hypothetical protein